VDTGGHFLAGLSTSGKEHSSVIMHESSHLEEGLKRSMINEKHVHTSSDT